MMELVSRIRAVLRRVNNNRSEEEYTVGSLYVSPSRHIVKNDGEPVALTLKEFGLLCLFIENMGRVFTRDQLLNSVWGYEFDGASRTVDVHIRTLRQKLGERGSLIETVRGVGYRFGEGNQ